MVDKGYYNYLGMPAAHNLDHAMLVIDKAFECMSYLVGSATETSEYRDVDIRMIMPDEKYEALFGDIPSNLSAFWSLLTVTISEYLQKRTGLPIDFQIQKMSDANKKYPTGVRIPLGNFVNDKRYIPEWQKSGYT